MAGWVRCIKKPTVNSVRRRSRGWQQGLLPRWASSLRLTGTQARLAIKGDSDNGSETAPSTGRLHSVGNGAHTHTHDDFLAPRAPCRWRRAGPGRCFQRLAQPTGTALPGLGCCGGGPPSSFQYGAWQLRIAGAVRRPNPGHRASPRRAIARDSRLAGILTRAKGESATRIRYLGPDVKRGKGREELRELHASDCEVAQPSSVARIRKKTSAWVNDCPDGHILVGCNFSARR